MNRQLNLSMALVILFAFAANCLFVKCIESDNQSELFHFHPSSHQSDDHSDCDSHNHSEKHDLCIDKELVDEFKLSNQQDFISVDAPTPVPTYAKTFDPKIYSERIYLPPPIKEQTLIKLACVRLLI